MRNYKNQWQVQKIRSQAINGHQRAAPDTGNHLKQGQKNETAQQQEIGHHGTADGKSPATYGLHINKEDEGIANDKQGSSSATVRSTSAAPLR